MKGLADSHPLGEGPSRVRLLRDPLPLCNLPQMNSVNSTSAIATQAIYVQSDAEIGLFSDEVVVNCAP